MPIFAPFSYLKNPILVLDPDAAAFLTAAAITDPTITSAINTLVIDLKDNALWNYMQALYPFVGGTATTHKYNLINPLDTDAAFRLTFNGTITHNSNGVTGDGSTGYYETHFSMGTDFANHFDAATGVYIRNNPAVYQTDMGAFNAAGPQTGMQFSARNSSNTISNRCMGAVNTTITGITTSVGFTSISRTNSSNYIVKKNTTTLGTITSASTGQIDLTMVGLALRSGVSTVISYSSRNHALSYIGKGLISAELDTFNTINTAFQTTLGRFV